MKYSLIPIEKVQIHFLSNLITWFHRKAISSICNPLFWIWMIYWHIQLHQPACTLSLYITPFTLANGLVYLEIVWELLRKLWNKSDIIQLMKVLLGNWAHTNWIGNRIHMKQAFHNIGLSRNTNASLICCEVSNV